MNLITLLAMEPRQIYLSRTVPNNASVVVTINGVVQHPTDNQGTRAYSVYDTILSFSEAPANGDEIQVRYTICFTSQ